jgi:Winged helix DNA-binding domain
MIAERLTAQLLAGEPARDPLAVAERLLAIQGQDPRGVRLAIRARTVGLSAGDVDRSLDERLLLVTWLNRGTLHMVRSEDYHWLHALTAPTLLTANARRLAQEGLPPDAATRGVGVIERALAAEGPLTRHQLRERLTTAGVRTEGQALVHLLALASLRGLIVRGPVCEGHHAFVLVRDWLGTPPPPVERPRALAELARRYLLAHAPADERDLAKWAGLPLRDIRSGLHAIAPLLTPRADGLLQLSGRPPAAPMPPPRLLGAFDPLLLGWRSREAILGPHRSIVTVNGLFRPFALVRGRAAATWSMPRGEVVLEPLVRLTRRDTAALAADAQDVVRYLADGVTGA